MPKRFTDTGKWADPWFDSLEPVEQLFWIFLLDNCDHAGIWKVNWRDAQHHIKLPFSFKEEVWAGRVVELDEGHWFISGFIGFQYGELATHSKTHCSVLKILEKYGLQYPMERVSKPLAYPYPRVKGTDKDKDIRGCKGGADSIYRALFEEFWNKYPRRQGSAPKEPAWKSFKKLHPTKELLELMYQALDRQAYANSWNNPKNRKFIPMPATWLNQRRWEDGGEGDAIGKPQSPEDAKRRTQQWLERTS